MKNYATIVEEMEAQLRKDMDIRWAAIKKSTETMLSMLDKMLQANTVEELAAMKKTMAQMKEHIQANIESAENSTSGKPQYYN